MKKSLYLLSILILFLINVVNVNAKVIDYKFMGKKVNDTFTINGNSSLTANTFINVTEDSTSNYLVVDLCSTVNNNITVTVPNDYDGSYTMFYKSYDLKESCSIGSYNGTIIRLFFNTTTFADSGNGNMAINNNTRIVNNSSYNGVFRLISMGLTDTIDLSDLTINNQNIIINDINGLQNNFNNSLFNTEQNINNNFNNTMKDIFSDCSSNNLFNKNNYNTFHGLINLDNYTWFQNNNAVVVYINVNPNTKYTVSRNIISNEFFVATSVDPPSYGSSITQFFEGSSGLDSISLTTGSNDNYLYVYVYYNGVSTGTLQQVLDNLIIIEGTTENCKNKLDSLNDTQKETNEKLDNLNDNITNGDSSEATGEAENFFSNFNTDTFGLTSVITAPLELIKSVTSKTCTPLQLTLPFVNKNLNLPCLSTIYENYFGSFLSIYRTITFGFVSYWICIKVFNLVKDFKNPEHDEIEVLDL